MSRFPVRIAKTGATYPMTISLASILRLVKANDILTYVAGAFGYTDIVGFILSYLSDDFKNGGRQAVINAVSIKADVMTKWAQQEYRATGGVAGSDAEKAFVANVLASRDKFTAATADFVGSLIPSGDSSVPAVALPKAA